ncbi:hypothetical protein BS47DRAFT_1314310 [Hydnum rufescens UP504]|uniref:NAD(P)-binding domain-containing protein n=1 Tax=Hydnum rufescens UP504 TaxID=1448309 RepID=A0A9P6B4I7_9AGAM|nr:hypothetical protein BS47DRAFT_1314310 [Hydnum rufescens UP504]
MKAPESRHFLILGATGSSGLLTVQLALGRRHSVTIYARSPHKLPEEITSNPLVTVVKGAPRCMRLVVYHYSMLQLGELTQEDAFESCFLPKEGVAPIYGVISALGPKVGQPSGNPLAAGYEVLLRLVHKYSIQRIVLLSTVSLSSPEDRFSIIREILVAGIKIIGYTAWTDVVAIGKLMQSSAATGLDVTLARVATLNDADGGSLKVGFIGDGKVGWMLARRDLAIFFVDEAEDPKWAGQLPFISS